MDDPRHYVKVADIIKSQIADGTLKAGQKVPSIDELRRQYGGARPTITKALKLLTDSNLVKRVPGLGYYVASD